MNTALPAFRPSPDAIRSVIFAFGLIVPLTAFAELSNDSLLGPGLRTRPAYDGSASQRLELVPVVRYFGQPWFARSTQGVLEGGVRMEIAPGFHAGAQLAYEPGRKTNDSDFLENHNVSDINRGASAGLHVEWDHDFGPMPTTLLARARRHTDSDLGAQADLRLSAGVYRSGRVAAGVFTQATWASAKSAGSFYGITPQQSATTGLPAFGAGSGLLFASFGFLWSLDLNQDWVVVGSMESRHLHGDAARSPLVERGSNYYASVGLAYHF
ncbi:MipA/OmpV family protein [Sulfuricaulis sp.]|jgi:outer membrane protein|uniref:MipA/OmpV family protein n=1 Tax=Sulfuricaulis sp. TaxID=2003553 RepID=UPI003559FF66